MISIRSLTATTLAYNSTLADIVMAATHNADMLHSPRYSLENEWLDWKAAFDRKFSVTM